MEEKVLTDLGQNLDVSEQLLVEIGVYPEIARHECYDTFPGRQSFETFRRSDAAGRDVPCTHLEQRRAAGEDGDAAFDVPWGPAACPIRGGGPAGERAAPSWRPREASTFRGYARFPSPSVMAGHDATGAVDSHHFRAARALLGWAMTDLARVSGLSLSTIRRLEQNVQAVSTRNHRSAVEALRTGGIRFLTLDDGTIALAELGHMAALAKSADRDDEVGSSHRSRAASSASGSSERAPDARSGPHDDAVRPGTGALRLSRPNP